jgi:uncharacterized membrane protein
MVGARGGAGKRGDAPNIAMMDETLFEAVIVPHRSLSRRGRRILLGAIAGLCTINAAVFISIGAWPVGGFTGIELLLASVMFSIHTRAAKASEMLMLSPGGLRILRTDIRGTRTERTLPPGWLQVMLVERPGRVPALLLVSHGRQEEIARALGEAEKRDLAAALDGALRRWRNPRFDNPQLRDDAEPNPVDVAGQEVTPPLAPET